MKAAIVELGDKRHEKQTLVSVQLQVTFKAS